MRYSATGICFDRHQCDGYVILGINGESRRHYPGALPLYNYLRCDDCVHCKQIVFQPYTNFDTMDPTSGVGEASVRIGCSIDEFGNPQSYLTQESSGMVTCIDNDGTGNETIFSMLDINGYFKVANPGPAKLSLSQTIYEGIFMKLIGENMMALFTDSNFLGVIILASGFGVALHQLTEDMPPEVNWSQILTVQLLEELAQIFVKFILWIIKLTPFAVVSLVAAAIGAQSDLGEVFSKIGYLCAAVAVGLFLQFALVYCSLYFSFLRKSPLSYFKHLIPALTMAFASASSAATIPLSISCAVKSGEVPLGVASFVIPLGVSQSVCRSCYRFLKYSPYILLSPRLL